MSTYKLKRPSSIKIFEILQKQIKNKNGYIRYRQERDTTDIDKKNDYVLKSNNSRMIQ